MKKHYFLALSISLISALTALAGTTTPSPICGLTVTINQTNVTCSGLCNGMAIAMPASGTAPYTYSWSPAGGTADTAKNLCPGTYTLGVMDAVGCSTAATFTITQPTALSLILSANNATCTCTGSLLGSANGGTPAYTYSWLPSGGNAASATNLCPGNYTLVVLDGNGCPDTAKGMITQATGPASTVLIQKNISCFGQCNGRITVSTSGGNTPYTYSWSPGSSTAAVDSNLCAGSYTLTTTDAGGCHSALAATITAPASALTSSITSQTKIKCGGQCTGTAIVSASGGTAPLTYAWTPSGGNLDTGKRLCAGTATVTVTDQNGCKNIDSVTIMAPLPLAVAQTQHNVSCNGGNDGTCTATPSGGTAPYTYSWLPTPFPFLLKSGPEVCFVTDSNGCRVTAPYFITQPTKIVPVVSAKPASCATCADGRDSVTVTGGKPPYTFSWSPGGGTSALNTGLTPGSYTCCVTDSAGCQICQSVLLSVLGIAEMEAPSMYIFPNPVGDMLMIQIPAQFNIHGMSLLNTVGELILEKPDFRANTLDVSALKPGTYLLRLYYDGGSMHKLFIKK